MKKVGDRMCVLFDISFIDYEDEMSNEGKHRWSNESELARPCAIKYARSVCVIENWVIAAVAPVGVVKRALQC